MSPMPQIAKLMMRKPTTAAITTLPSQLEEGLRRPRSIHRPWGEKSPAISSRRQHIIRSGPLRRNMCGQRQAVTSSTSVGPAALLTAWADSRNGGISHGWRAAAPAGGGQLEDE